MSFLNIINVSLDNYSVDDFVIKCFNIVKQELDSELDNISDDFEGEKSLNVFAIHYYDKGKITFENRNTYNMPEYCEKYPKISISIKKSKGFFGFFVKDPKDMILQMISGYINNELRWKFLKYEFFLFYNTVDARTDFSIAIKRVKLKLDKYKLSE